MFIVSTASTTSVGKISVQALHLLYPVLGMVHFVAEKRAATSTRITGVKDADKFRRIIMNTCKKKKRKRWRKKGKRKNGLKRKKKEMKSFLKT